VTHDKKQITDECDGGKKIYMNYNKFEIHKIIKNDAPIRPRVSPQRPVINLFGNLVTRYTWTIESVRLLVGLAG